MIWRAGLLMVATLAALGVGGAAFGETHASAWRVWAAATLLLLAPLFWPGRGPAPWRRVLAWSLVGLGAGLVATLGFGPPGRWDAVARVALQLGALLLLAHALCAWLEGPLGGAGSAGAAVAMLLALAGTLPVWAGPATMGVEGGGTALDTLLAASPLTHLAVASDNDLLRNPWLYENTPLGGLPAEYPAGTTLAAAYAAGLAALGALAWRRDAFTESVLKETAP